MAAQRKTCRGVPVFVRFMKNENSLFRARSSPVEVNLDQVEYFQSKAAKGVLICCGTTPSLSKIFANVHPVSVPRMLRITASYAKVLEEVKRAQQAARPAAAAPILDLGGILSVNLNHIAVIEQSVLGAQLLYASGHSLPIPLTPDEIRSRVPECFLSIVD